MLGREILPEGVCFMHIVLWLALCFFASVGVVQLLSWLICALGCPRQAGRAYQVIALEREPGPLEEQLRYEIHLLRWGATYRPAPLLLLDTGLDQEARQVCRNLLGGISEVVVCRPGELAGIICEAEQIAENAGG